MSKFKKFVKSINKEKFVNELAPEQPSHNLKELSSADTWVSPFRNNDKPQTNLYQQYKDGNKMDKIEVPERFRKSAPSSAKPAKKVDTATTKKVDNASTKSLLNESIKTPRPDTSDLESERPLKDTEIEGGSILQDVPKIVDDKIDLSGVDGVTGGVETTEVATDSATVTDFTEKTSANAEIDVKSTNDIDATDSNLPPSQADGIHHEPETVQIGAADDDIKKLVEETPIELNSAAPGAKFEPVATNKKTLDSLSAKPGLLRDYQELNKGAIGSVAKHLDDPEKLIYLGQGLHMTQQQLLDIAASRVAPVLANINSAVDNTKADDQVRLEQEYDQKVEKHNTKLLADFTKYSEKVAVKQDKYQKEIDIKFANISKSKSDAEKAHSEFQKNNALEIETANKEYEERETKAVEKHKQDLETLKKNHEELEATKKQELADAKTGQETATEEIEELQEKKIKLDDENSELSTKVEELTKRLEEQRSKLAELKTEHEDELEVITKNKSTKEELETKIEAANKDLEVKQSKHEDLSAEVGILAGSIASYTATLTSLNKEKQDRAVRLEDAKQKKSSWIQDKQTIAAEVAADHERKRAEAREAIETEKFEEAEEKRIEKEEAARIKREEEEEKERLKLAEEEEERNQKEIEEQKKQAKLEQERLAQIEVKEQERLQQDEKERKLLAEREQKQQKEDRKEAEARAKQQEEASRNASDEIIATPIIKDLEDDEVIAEPITNKNQVEDGEEVVAIPAHNKKELKESNVNVIPVRDEKDIDSRKNVEEVDPVPVNNKKDINSGHGVNVAAIPPTSGESDISENKVENVQDVPATPVNNRKEVDNNKDITDVSATPVNNEKGVNSTEDTEDVAVISNQQVAAIPGAFDEFDTFEDASDDVSKVQNKGVATSNDSREDFVEQDDDKQRRGNTGKTVGAGILGAGAGATGASAIDNSGSDKNTSSAVNSSGSDKNTSSAVNSSDVSKSVNDSNVNRSATESSTQAPVSKSATTPVADAPKNSNKAVVGGADASKNASNKTSKSAEFKDDGYDIVTVYEEVDAAEYARHKSDPDYVTVSSKEFEAYKADNYVIKEYID